MKIETKLAHTGLAPDGYGGIVNLPPHRASTILFDNLADFEKADRGEWPLPSYGRYGTPSTLSLEATLAELDGADYSIVLGSGMAAIAVAIMAFAEAGDHVLMVDTAYGPTRRFCEQKLKKLGVEVTYYDPAIGAGIKALMKPNTKVVYCESPGSLTFEMQDIPAISEVAHAASAVVIADCTWATPLYFRAFEKGVDVVMHSATKYISGHSDLVMGVLSCKEKHYKQLLYTYRNFGASPSADSCYLAMRGLKTMTIRMERQMQNALTIARWFQSRPEVEKVLCPMLEGDAGHALWKRDMTGGASLFGVLLKPYSHAQVAAMIDNLELFGLGYSWGGFESLVITFDAARSRTATEWNHKGVNLRFHIGLEHPDDLIADLEQGFKRLARA
jgi:cysteine-S-conjugate beta-lyase